MLRLGIDMGGTNLRAALVDDGGIITKKVVPCPANAEDPQTVLDAIAELVSSIITQEVVSIGVGVPSVVDVEKGIVYNVANIPSWKEVHLKDFLQERFPGVDVSINNDANCFALGEATYGNAKAFDDVVGLSLGTGTGAGMVIGGKLYNGANVGAGEVGYLPYRDTYFEDYTSGAFFNNKGIDSKTAASKAKAGDEGMIALWKEFGKHVGAMVKAILLAYDPQAIVIGGGMSSVSELYKDAMLESLNDFYYPQTVKNLSISFTSVPDVALLGAASLCNL